MEELERPTSSRSIRASRFTQTISRFKGIIRIPVRKVATQNGPHPPQKPSIPSKGRAHQLPENHPYSRASAIRRESMKPYMSQPMLGLQRSSMDTDPYQHSQHGSDISTSASPDPSPSRLNSDFPLPAPKVRPSEESRRHSRRLSLHSLASQPINEISAPETVPHPDSTNGGSRQSLSTSEDFVEIRPPTPPPKSARHITPKSRPELPSSPPRPEFPSLEHSTPSGTAPSNNTPSSPPPQARIRPPRPIRPLPPVPSGLNRGLSVTATTTEKQPAAHLAEPRPIPVTYDSSPAVPTRISLSSPPMPNASPSEAPASRTVSNPPLESLLRSASETDGQALQVINYEAIASTLDDDPATPTRPLKISLPSLSRRISLLQATSGGARLSPTVLHRPLPLPILNLPKLPPTMPSSGDDVLAEGSSLSRRRSERVGLGSMPALPLQGALRGAGGHEEPDDMEDDDEDMDDIDEETTEDDHGADDDDTSSHTLGTATSDTSSGRGFSYEGRGSYDLPSPSEASGAFSRPSARPELPPLTLTSPLDIRFQAGATASSTAGMVRNAEGVEDSLSDKKGKQRQVVPSPLSSGYASSLEREPAESDMGVATSRSSRPPLVVSTPRPSYQSFPLAGVALRGDYPQSIGLSRSQGSDTTPSAQPRADPFLNASSHSPLATPRALSQAGDSPTSSSNVNWQRNSMLSGTGSPIGSPGDPFVQRPSFYRRASRSLVDLHSIATKEAIDKLLREEEEKQDMVRRQMSLKRIAGRNVTNGKSPNLPASTPEETLPNQAHEGDATRVTTTLADATKTDASRFSAGPSNVTETSKLATTGSNTVGDTGVGPVPGRSGMDGGIRSSMVGGIGSETKQQNRISMAPAYEVAMATPFANPLQAPARRRRSMPTFNESTAPPPYPSFDPFPLGRHAGLKIAPREDEGREQLPGYSNAIYLKAIMPRKMEFSAPGVQSKDRKWRRVMCVLEGTMFKVYRCPVGPGGVSAIEQWWESKVGAGDSVSYPSGPGSSAASPPGPGSARARANIEEVVSREEEKASQQYLRYPVQHELAVNGGSLTPEDEGEQSTSRIQPPTPPPSVFVQRHHHHPSAQVAISKSALNLAVHFLKPGSRHTRSSSDAGPPSPSLFKPPANQPRSSLNLPRSGTTTPTSSSFSSTSRSHSPLPSASTSTTTVGAGSSRSNSPMPSSRLVVPSSSSTLPSRPTTPSTGGCSSGRSSSRMRNHDAPTPPRSARSDTSSKAGDVPEPHEHDLLRTYTMQNAESGLGNDYLKRKNVIRVRLEGEQFLLQAKDVPSVVQWIEGLQSATNIALDLDDRPMPRGPIFPRRRRRRRPQVPPITTGGAAGPTRPTTVTETYTPTSATAGQPALRRTG